MSACSCDVTLANTGVPGCYPIASVTRKMIAVPKYAADGTKNTIDLTADLVAGVLPTSFIDAKINEADDTKRWYVLPNIDNVEDVKGDPITEAANSGQSFIVQDGVRTFTGQLFKQSAVLLGKLEDFKCTDFGFYIVDIEGQLIGSIDGDNLDPIEADKNTFNPRMVKSTDTTVAKLQINFEWSRIEKDSNLRLLTCDETESDMLDVSGLLDVNQAISAPTTTSFTDTETLDYGSAANPIKVEGLVIGDFSLFNNTDSLSVTITSVTEVSEGVYDFVIPAQTGSDSLTLSGSKTGYEFADVTFTV